MLRRKSVKGAFMAKECVVFQDCWATCSASAPYQQVLGQAHSCLQTPRMHDLDANEGINGGEMKCFSVDSDHISRKQVPGHIVTSLQCTLATESICFRSKLLPGFLIVG